MFKDTKHLAQLVVVALMLIFGLTAVFTDKTPLNPYWITLFTTVLTLGAVTAGSKKDGDEDESDSIREKVGKWLQGERADEKDPPVGEPPSLRRVRWGYRVCLP